MGTLHEEQYTFMMIYFSVLRMKNMPDKFLENIKTHILSSITFLF